MQKEVVNNPGPTIIGGVIGVQIFNTASTAANVLNDTINTGGYTAGICTAIQFGKDCYDAFKGKYNMKQFGQKTVTNVAVNGTSVVGGAGGSAVGGAIGTAIFPGTGTVIGSVVGGITGSLTFGGLVNDKLNGKIIIKGNPNNNNNNNSNTARNINHYINERNIKFEEYKEKMKKQQNDLLNEINELKSELDILKNKYNINKPKNTKKTLDKIVKSAENLKNNANNYHISINDSDSDNEISLTNDPNSLVRVYTPAHFNETPIPNKKLWDDSSSDDDNISSSNQKRRIGVDISNAKNHNVTDYIPGLMSTDL